MIQKESGQRSGPLSRGQPPAAAAGTGSGVPSARLLLGPVLPHNLEHTEQLLHFLEKSDIFFRIPVVNLILEYSENCSCDRESFSSNPRD